MTFGRKLHRRIHSDWKEGYICYKIAKTFLKAFKMARTQLVRLIQTSGPQIKKSAFSKSSESSFSSNFEELGLSDRQLRTLQGLVRIEEKFYSFMNNETIKILLFMDVHLNELKRNLFLLKGNIVLLQGQISAGIRHELKHALRDFYKKVLLIEQYIELNREGFDRITTKHRILSEPFRSGEDARSRQKDTENVQNSKLSKPLLSGQSKGILDLNVLEKKEEERFKAELKQEEMDVKEIKTETEKIYLKYIYPEKKKDKQLKKLQRYCMPKTLKYKDLKKVFFFAGCALSLVLTLCLFYIGDLTFEVKSFSYVFPVFRGSLLFILYYFLLGINVFAWTRNHINYKRVFGFNHHYSPVVALFKRSIFFLGLWVLVYTIYVQEVFEYDSIIQREFLPIVVYIFLFAYLIFPTRKHFNGEGRVFMYRIFLRIITFKQPDFAMIWLTNQFISFVVPMRDIQYSICFVSVGGLQDLNMVNEYCKNRIYALGLVAAILPYFFFSVQLIQRMWARKSFSGPSRNSLFVNCLAVTVSITSSLSTKTGSTVLFFVWIPFTSLTTLCATTNDFYNCMFDTDENDKKKIRTKRMYRYGFIYYVIFMVILILRCSWMLTLSNDIADVFTSREFLVGLTATLEIIRRGTWNFLTVERENINQLRAKFYVPQTFERLPYSYEKILDMYEKLENDLQKSSEIEKEENKEKLIALQSNMHFFHQISNLDLNKNVEVMMENRDRFISATSIILQEEELAKEIKDFKWRLEKSFGPI